VTTPADERVTVGLVRGLHGLGGAVRVEVLSDDPERFAVGSVLFVERDERPLTIAWTGPAKPGLLVSFAEVTTRESAERLRDRYLEAVPGPPLPAGIYYWHQLAGLAVTTTEGEPLGNVADVFRAGAGEVYVVRGGDRGEILVPAVRDVVVELDPAAGRLVVDVVALDLPDKPPRRRRRHGISREDRKLARRRGKGSRTIPKDASAQPVEAASPDEAGPMSPDEVAGPAPPDEAAGPTPPDEA
jgi:16S rRNA processing protein RimM